MDKSAVMLRNNVAVRGEGEPTLLFANGFGCDQSIWQPVARRFSSRHQIVCFDYVGSGQSDMAYYDEQRYQSLSGYAQDLVEVIEALDLYDIVLVAHSISGSIATLAFPQIKHRLRQIVMLNPSPRYIHDEPDYHSGFTKEDVDQLLILMEQNFFGWAQGMAQQVMDAPKRPELSERLQQQFASGHHQITRQFARATFYSDVREALPQVTCPVAIIQPQADTVVPLQVVEYMVSRFPDASLHLIDARGHYPHISAPAAVAEVLSSILLRGGQRHDQ